MADDDKINENNEEFDIDFRKLLGFFKKKSSNSPNKSANIPTASKSETSEGEDSSISFDLGKVKNFFKGTITPSDNSDKEEDSEHIDFSKIKSVIFRHQTLFLLLLILFVQFIPNAGFWPWGGIWMRMQTENLPQIENWATTAVHNYYTSQIASQISQQYPNLPEANKNKLVEKEFNKILSEQKEQIDAQITATREQFFSKFQYEVGDKKYTYMPDIDPYAYLRFARNKIETGRFEDTIKDGITWDDHSLAPIGRPVNINFHHYVLVTLYRILSIINPQIPIMQAATYFPIVFILLSLIPAFFIGHRLAGNVGGFFAASMLVLNAAVTSRTPWGHADTDAYNIFFPMLIIWLFIESIVVKDYKKKLGLSLITAFCLGIFTKAWAGGWWYVFYFVLIAMFINLIYLIVINYRRIIQNPWNFIKSDSEIKNILFVTVIFFVFSGILISLFSSVAVFTSSIFSPFGFSIIKSASHATLWPNVYTTVAELNPASVSTIIEQAGGKLLMLISIIGILFTLTIKDSMGKRDIKYALLLGIWFIATIYASTKGVRFVMLMIPAFSIAFGVAAGVSYNWITKWMKKDLKIPKIISGTVIIVLFLLLLIAPAKNSYAAVKGNFPLINDAWWDALTKIKTESASNAIINSWWDFGHHFKYIADRAVTFDGATQNYPHAHWIGRVLSTDNEDEAIGILRMLDCGSNKAFETLDNEIQDTAKSVRILYQIIVLDKEKARTILKEYIDNPDDVLQYTHCNPPEDYFITSDDMIGKSGVWAHFGNWNFERADIWMNLKNLPRDEAIAKMIEKYDYTEEKAESLYLEVQALNSESEANSWISPWPGYASGLNGCDVSNNIAKCGNGLFVNMNDSNDYEAMIQVQNGAGIPKSLVYVDTKTNKLIEKEFNNSNVGLSAVLIPSGNSYTSLFVSPELAKSMFTRLFFMAGQGLEHFDLFDSQKQVTGGDIYVWKVDWRGHAPNVHPDLIKKITVAKGDTASVEYIGWLDNGEIFDSSIVDWNKANISKDASFDDKLTKPLKFTVGSGQMIPGFDNGVLGMNLNAVKTIKIQPAEAYGTDPSAHPLGNQILNFKIKLVGIE